MTHFSFTDWADFANGLGAPEHIAAMQSHLDNGCNKCKRLLSICESVRSLAMRTAEYEPPATAVRAAKAAFVLAGARTRRSRVAETAELVFDSLGVALQAGVRSMEIESTTRKLLYRRGSVQVDLSVDRVSDTRCLQIVGQVLDSAASGSVVPGVTVFLTGGKSRLAQGVTNSFGEFHLECPSRENLRLCIWISADKEVVLPLDQYISGVSREKS